MNTKKLLISGAIATGMLVGVAMPSVFAANKITFQKDYLKAGESVTIMQNNADGKSIPSIDLAAKTVKEAVEKKFTGTTVKGELKTVGTGTVVELADGVKITVVYKGDANGDGKISIADSGLIVRSAFGKKKLTEVQNKAADVNGDEKPSVADAGVIVRLLFGGKNAKTAYSKMEEFMPEDVVVIDNNVVAEKAEAVKEVAEVKAVCDDVKVEATEKGAKATVTLKADQATKQLSELKSELLGTAMKLAADNEELIEAANSVKLSYNNGTGTPIELTITKAQIADILTNPNNEARKAINALLGNKTLASLAGDKLTVTVELDAAKALLNNAKEGATQVYEIDFAALTAAK